MTGHNVRLAPDVLDKDEPYFDAGPKSKCLKTEDTLRIKDVCQEYASANLIDNEENMLGFGKIRTSSLIEAEIVGD